MDIKRLADALAALQRKDGFALLMSYEEQATFVLEYINEQEPSTPAEETAKGMDDSCRTAFLALVELSPTYRTGTVPLNVFALPSTAARLRRYGVIEWRSYPNQGFYLTDFGREVAEVYRVRQQPKRV